MKVTSHGFGRIVHRDCFLVKVYWLPSVIDWSITIFFLICEYLPYVSYVFSLPYLQSVQTAMNQAIQAVQGKIQQQLEIQRKKVCAFCFCFMKSNTFHSAYLPFFYSFIFFFFSSFLIFLMISSMGFVTKKPSVKRELT